jgi:hypothetical protein
LVLLRGNLNIDSARETFALNQFKAVSEVSLSKESDFFINQKYTFEIVGREKTSNQFHQIEMDMFSQINLKYIIKSR